MKDFIKRKHVWRLIGLFTLDALLFGATNAASAPSFVVIVGFVLLMVTYYYLIHGLIGFLGLYGIKINRKRTLALYITMLTGLLVALQSIGELGSRDIMVVLPLILLAYLYSAYAKKSKHLV